MSDEPTKTDEELDDLFVDADEPAYAEDAAERSNGRAARADDIFIDEDELQELAEGDADTDAANTDAANTDAADTDAADTDAADTDAADTDAADTDAADTDAADTDAVAVVGDHEDGRVAELQARVAELSDRLEKTVAETAQLQDRLLRKAADLENARRRHQREKEEQSRFASEAVLKDIVPVLDDLERAVAHLDASAADSSLLEGVQMVVRKFAQVLLRQGVSPVDALGKPFDPQFHEAIQQRPDESVPHNTVVQEFQRGYVLHERLLRPALVVVAQGGPARDEPEDDTDSGSDLAEPVSDGHDAADQPEPPSGDA